MYRKVVIASDGSDEAINAAQTAIALGLLKGSEVALVGALDVSGVTFHGLENLNEEELHRLQEACRQRNLVPVENAIKKLGIEKVESLVVQDTPAAAISETADKVGANLVVVGRRGLGAVRSFFMGSVSLKVLELCERPVLVVPKSFTAEKASSRPTIIAPTDFSAAAEVGLKHAHALAKELGSTVVLVHACRSAAELPADLPADLRAEIEEGEDPERGLTVARQLLERIAAPMREDGVNVEIKVLAGNVGKTIVKVVRETNAGLIVMSSHGASGIVKYYFGGFSASVVKQSSVPVLVAMAT